MSIKPTILIAEDHQDTSDLLVFLLNQLESAQICRCPNLQVGKGACPRRLLRWDAAGT
jgi:hypothetical protein